MVIISIFSIIATDSIFFIGVTEIGSRRVASKQKEARAIHYRADQHGDRVVLNEPVERNQLENARNKSILRVARLFSSLSQFQIKIAQTALS